MMMQTMLPGLCKSLGLKPEIIVAQITDASERIKTFDERFNRMEKAVLAIGRAVISQGEQAALDQVSLMQELAEINHGVWQVRDGSKPAGEGHACAVPLFDNFISHHPADDALTVVEVVPGPDAATDTETNKILGEAGEAFHEETGE